MSQVPYRQNPAAGEHYAPDPVSVQPQLNTVQTEQKRTCGFVPNGRKIEVVTQYRAKSVVRRLL